MGAVFPPGAARVLRRVALLSSMISAFASAALAQAPPVAMHQLDWHIHSSLVTAERSLQGFWIPLIEETNRGAEILMRGGQGPADDPCCVGFEALNVSTFSDANLLTIDSQAELDQLDQVGTGARVIVVQSLSVCGGTTGNPIGCADFPFCGSEPASRKAVLSLEAYEMFDSFPQVLAHEIGHTTCLDHVANETCELMAASSGGGCVSISGPAECGEYVEDAQTNVGTGTCECYASTTEFAPDGQSCSAVAGGICSGGVCGDPGGEASAELFASGDPAIANGGTPNRAIGVSGLTGEWAEHGTFTANRDVQGLAYSPGRDVLYGVAPDGGDTEVLLEVDPTTGATTTIATISGLIAGTTVTGLAWDPGATASTADDRLLAIDVEPAVFQQGQLVNFSNLYALDPETGVATRLALGGVLIGGPGGFSGLAYDPLNDALYASAEFTSNPSVASGLYRIETTCTAQGGLFCDATEVFDPDLVGTVNKFQGGLAYDPVSHRFYHLGRQAGDRTEFDSYEADALAANVIDKTGTRGVDALTVGALAAVSAVPEPGHAGLAAVVGLLVLRAARRRSYSGGT